MKKTGTYVSGRFYSNVKYEANRRGIPFDEDITLDYLDQLLEEQDFKCFYSGQPIDAKTRDHITASLDRRDSSQGYTRENIQFVHKKVNMSKWILSEADYLSIVKNIYENMQNNKTKKEFEKYFVI